MRTLERHAGERGIALLVVLFVLLLTTILALEIKSSAALHMRLAKNKRDDFLMRQAMRGQLEVLKQVILADRQANQVETLEDLWTQEKYTAFQHAPAEPADEEQAAEPVSSENYEVSALVEDEARKFNLQNLAADDEAQRNHWEEVFLRLLVRYREDFDQYAISRSDAEQLLRKIKDWLKREDDGRGVPRPATSDTKKIMVTPDELLMIEGFTRDILYDVPVPVEQQEEGEPTEVPGLIRYLTLWSAGPVNLNTAEKVVVHSLFTDSDRDLADRFLDWRDQAAESDSSIPASTTTDVEPTKNMLKNLQELTKIDGFDAQVLQRNALNDQTVAVKSEVFSIHFKGESPDGITRQERWVISRNQVGFKTILYEERNDPVAKKPEEETR